MLLAQFLQNRYLKANESVQSLSTTICPLEITNLTAAHTGHQSAMFADLNREPSD
jgi:hypothetical protein